MSQTPTFEQIQEEIASMLSIPDDELTDEQKAVMDDYLNELGSQEAAKVDGFAQFVRLQSDLAEACKKESQRLASKAKTAQARIAYLKERYLGIMNNHGLKKVSGNAYTISARKSESVAVPADLSGLHDIYLRRKEIVEPDKQVIKEALKVGIPVPGCSLVENWSLQIR